MTFHVRSIARETPVLAQVGVATRFGRELERGPNGGTFRPRRKLREVSSVGIRWVCARVNSNTEFTVADNLRDAGFETFAPHGVKVQRHARTGVRQKRAIRERDYPVFSGYVFVGEPAGLMVAKRSHLYIIEVLGDGIGPLPIPKEFISRVADLWLQGEWDERSKRYRQALHDIKAGDKVKFADSPLMDGLLAIVDDMPSQTQAVIRYALFGKEHTQRVDVKRLELI